MMKVTDRHFRHLLRLITKQTTLYTEMININAIVHRARVGDEAWLRRELASPAWAGPLGKTVLQLGGSDVPTFEDALLVAKQYHDFSAVNLNCGCPSRAVQAGRFGAVLMREPSLVKDICTRIKQHCDQVTVKCRIGTCDKLSLAADDSFDELRRFVATVAKAGVSHFVVHARLAVLEGLCPRRNRKVPPLQHELVHKLAREFAPLEFTINGGITSLSEVQQHLASGVLAGAMLGRAVQSSPWVCGYVCRHVYGHASSMCHKLLERSRRKCSEEWGTPTHSPDMLCTSE